MHTLSSIIDLSNGSVSVDGNAYLSNTTIRISSNSTLLISGCLNLNNLTVDLDYSSYNTDQTTNLTLFTFAANCPPLSNFHIDADSSDNCIRTTATSNVMKNSVVVTLIKDNLLCQSQTTSTTLPYWAMITIISLSVLVVVMALVIILGQIIPVLRVQLFPFRDQVPDYTL